MTRYMAGVRTGVFLAVGAASAIFLVARAFVDEISALRIEHFSLMVLAISSLAWTAAAVLFRERDER